MRSPLIRANSSRIITNSESFLPPTLQVGVYKFQTAHNIIHNKTIDLL